MDYGKYGSFRGRVIAKCYEKEVSLAKVLTKGDIG